MDVGQAITEAMREQRASDMWDVFRDDPRHYAQPGDGSSVWLGRWSGDPADLPPSPNRLH